MKLFAFHSPAIAPLWELFSASVREHTTFELCPIEAPHEYDGAQFGEPRYWQLMKWMSRARLELVEHQLEPFVTSGCDSIFLRDAAVDLARRLGPAEFLAADDKPEETKLCGCLEAIIPGEWTRLLFERIYSDPHCGLQADDPLLNRYRDTVRWAALPHDQYWNLCGPRWNAGDPVKDPPEKIIWFHANFTIGVANKRHLLTTVRDVCKRLQTA